jgi:hypothetical protein
VAQALKARGQDVLQEAMQEFSAGQGQHLGIGSIRAAPGIAPVGR